jgi:hypothetical protein
MLIPLLPEIDQYFNTSPPYFKKQLRFLSALGAFKLADQGVHSMSNTLCRTPFIPPTFPAQPPLGSRISEVVV